MKNYYKISEISKLYDIGVDSLRYYEKLGILTPKRDTNGYRLYNLTDLYKLNIIRDLRSLDFSMAQIKDYLDKQSLENTLNLLHKEKEMVSLEIANLEAKRLIIEDRIRSLSSSYDIETGNMKIKHMQKRYCVRLNEHITRDEEMDLLIKKLHQKHEDKIRDLGNLTIGAFLSMPSIDKGIANVYDSVFFVLDPENPSSDNLCLPTRQSENLEHDFILPEGNYLSCFYRGSYEQNAARVREMLSYIKDKGFSSSNEAFEIFTIDNRDTIQTEEFLTEIQIYLGGN